MLFASFLWRSSKDSRRRARAQGLLSHALGLVILTVAFSILLNAPMQPESLLLKAYIYTIGATKATRK